MEKQESDKPWRKAFEEAEISPSENVWTNIELSLEKAKAARLRRRLVFYQGLAAASVLFAVAVTIGVFMIDKSSEVVEVASIAIKKSNPPPSSSVQEADPQPKSTQSSSEQLAANSSNSNLSSGDVDKQASAIVSQLEKASQSSHNSSEKFKGERKPNSISTESFSMHLEGSSAPTTVVAANVGKTLEETHAIVVSSEEKSTETYRQVSLTNHNLPSLVDVRKPEMMSPNKTEANADPVALMLARLNDREKAMNQEGEEKKKANRNENVWTSVGFSAGAFNPINARVTPPAASTATATFAASNAVNKSIVSQQAKASGTSYSVGVNVGKKISNHWVLQGGVNYLSQSADYMASYGVTDPNLGKFRPPNINELADLVVSDASASNKLVSTAPYNVNNSMQYLSVPIQAGYLIVNKKVGWQMNGGLATDIFLQNTVRADVQNTNDTGLGIGTSPYRQLNVSGLVGSEVSYRFSSRYRIALNPGLRYPLANIYNSETVHVRPLTFDIGLRFRYIFQ